jgi:hypothetical protein
LGLAATACAGSGNGPAGEPQEGSDAASSSSSSSGGGSGSSSGGAATDGSVGDGEVDAHPLDATTSEAGSVAPPPEAGAVSCSSLPLCDDFESDTAGAAPNPTLWHPFMGCNPNNANGPATGGGLLIGVDSSMHHSGANSLRVVGGDSCGYYAIHTGAFTTLGQQIYTRFWALFPPGGGSGGDAGAATPNHNGFLSMYSGATSGSDPAFYTNYGQSGPTSGQLRLGFQANVVDWNNIINGMDSTLPDLDPMGTMLSVDPQANTWNCYEFHIDETNNHIEFWYNGASVSGLSFSGVSTQGVSDQWSTQGPPPLQIKSFGLGWLALNGSETVYYDDVALAGVRIGCN